VPCSNQLSYLSSLSRGKPASQAVRDPFFEGRRLSRPLPRGVKLK